MEDIKQVEEIDEESGSEEEGEEVELNVPEEKKNPEQKSAGGLEPPYKKKKQEVTMPKKSKFRMRAHINPLSEINYPWYIK